MSPFDTRRVKYHDTCMNRSRDTEMECLVQFKAVLFTVIYHYLDKYVCLSYSHIVSLILLIYYSVTVSEKPTSRSNFKVKDTQNERKKG